MVVIDTPGGPVSVNTTHVGPEGSVAAPATMHAPAFRPPSIFSAPLPSGSGARALGLAGAFTALADDATAASWNPAGLIQLERPEASAVFRAGWETHQYASGADDFNTSRDDVESRNLNYFSVVYPFQAGGRNAVVSLNYQEVYDFTQRFTANQLSSTGARSHRLDTATYSDTTVQHVEQDSTTFPDGTIDIDVTSHLTTREASEFDQLLRSDSISTLEFEQSGSIDAVTPALAVEVTPTFSLGAALNVYRDNMLGGQAIRSRTRAVYSGTSASAFRATSTRETWGTYTYEGTIHVPPGATVPVPLDIPIEGSGTYEPFTDTTRDDSGGDVRFEGVYEEQNAFDDLRGINGTFGALWTVSPRLNLGADLDLPWTAEARQTKTVRNTVTTYDASGRRVLDVAESSRTETRDVEFRFPLYWSVGALWRWSPVLYSTFDVSQTRWSEFSFQAEGDPKLNPLDGSTYGEHGIDDCWAARYGTEYLVVLTRTEIPLRAGLLWEQHPAVGAPDDYWGVSAGTGISLGRGPGRLILDVAYAFTWSDNVSSLVPDRPDLSTDVRRHQCYVSGIWHF